MDGQDSATNLLSSSNIRSAILRLKIERHKNCRPVYRQLCDQLREAIVDLRLMPGELLPSSRELASHLGISRKTVSRCYEELLSQGFVTSEVGVGTFVRQMAKKGSPEAELKRTAELRLNRYAASLMTSTPEPTNQGEHPELNFGASPPEELPLKPWRHILLKQLRERQLSHAYYDTDPFGFWPLRNALAGYLHRSRALECLPEQIIVFPHALSPLRLFAQVVIEADDAVVIENPGFPFARRVLDAAGARLIPIAVDNEGLRVADLKSLAERPRLVYVTPSHQDPTGAMLTLDRRNQLIEWAKDNQCFILEDDYDCEFRFTGSTLPALMSLDKDDNVAYIGDMWKTLFPLINLGYLVLPESLVEVFRHIQSLSWAKVSTSLPFYDQLAITEFINDGHFERHIRKTRAVYANRYRNLILGLTRLFGDQITWAKDSGGMQLLVRFKGRSDDSNALAAARQAGLSIIPTSSYYCTLEKPRAHEFLLSFAPLQEKDMTARLERWAILLGG